MTNHLCSTPSEAPSAPRRGLVCALILAIVALAPAFADRPEPAAEETEASAEKPANAQAEAPAEAEEIEIGPYSQEPPEGVEWQVDDEGNEYFVTPVPKEGLAYIRIDDETIRTRWGIPLKLEREDEENFYFKTFKTRLVPPQGPEPPTEEELAEAAKTYEADVSQVDRLELVAFDDGLPKQGSLWRNGFDVGDLDGDGHLDIVHGQPRKAFSGPIIFRGDGEGGWSRWEEVTWPQRVPWDYGDAEAADFNGDGHVDVAFAFHLRGVVAFVGDGEGNFKAWHEGMMLELPGHQGDPAFSSREIEEIDWNGDGRKDLLVFSEGPRGFQHVGLPNSTGKIVYLNQGDGSWTIASPEEPSPVYGDEVAIGNFDGDGRLDFLTSTNVRGEKELLNLADEDGLWRPTAVELFRPRAWVWAVGAGDFNEDGRDDMALAYLNSELGVRRNGLDVLLSTEDGAWQRKVLKSEEGLDLGDFHTLASGDVDGDGHLDLVGTTRFAQIFIYLGDGEGNFALENEPELAVEQRGCEGYGLRVVDLDGDGRDEIIASFAAETCPKLGWISAWKTRPRPASEDAAEAADPTS